MVLLMLVNIQSTSSEHMIRTTKLPLYHSRSFVHPIVWILTGSILEAEIATS